MRINGEWYECDDGFVRPVVRGEILGARGFWRQAPFLVDTGADRTVFSAAILDVLGLDATPDAQRIAGVGGVAEAVQVVTKIQLPRADGGLAVFRGVYAAFERLEALDMCVLGRDIMRMFAVIVDQPGDVVTLIREGHRYVVESGVAESS